MSDFRDTDVKKPGWEIHIFDNDILIGPLIKNKYTVQYSTSSTTSQCDDDMAV